MDVETIDNEYSQLQQETQETVQTIQALATKLQAAPVAGGGDTREWLLDLKSIALQVQQEQMQMQMLLQAIHQYALNTVQQVQPVQQPQPTSMQGFQQSAPPPQQGGGLRRFFGGNFGQAIEQGAGMGVGFGVTNAVIGSIFD